MEEGWCVTGWMRQHSDEGTLQHSAAVLRRELRRRLCPVVTQCWQVEKLGSWDVSAGIPGQMRQWARACWPFAGMMDTSFQGAAQVLCCELPDNRLCADCVIGCCLCACIVWPRVYSSGGDARHCMKSCASRGFFCDMHSHTCVQQWGLHLHLKGGHWVPHGRARGWGTCATGSRSWLGCRACSAAEQVM
jgi:hypothetical protein